MQSLTAPFNTLLFKRKEKLPNGHQVAHWFQRSRHRASHLGGGGAHRSFVWEALHRRDAAEVLRRVWAVAAEALRSHQSGVGLGSLPHDGHDFRRSRTGVAVPRWRGRFGVQPSREKRVPVRTGFVGVGGGLNRCGVGAVLRGQV